MNVHKYLLLLIVALAVAMPTVGQDATTMTDFVKQGSQGNLTHAQIESYVRNWGQSDWLSFYTAAATQAGMDNPSDVAQTLLAEDLDLLNYYSSEINRTNTWDSTMRAPWYWLKDSYSCDGDADTDYMFHFTVSAYNVLNMRWFSTSAWISLIIGGWTGRLKAFGDNTFTRICIGDSRICTVNNGDGCDDGARAVKNVLRLKP